MKKILGLDLGTTSIGWALVNEKENENEQSCIIKLGVRVNPLTTDEQTDFEKGKPLSTNANRTLMRGARRNLQRYKLRRKFLVEKLKQVGIISEHTVLTEEGKDSTFETLRLRAKAARERIEKEELARVLLTINKKRGYKSSRKAKNEEEGTLLDGMSIAKELSDRGITPGVFVYELLKKKKKYIPEFYRSDLKEEFDHIWEYQQTFYPAILSSTLYNDLQGKNKGQTWKICEVPFQVVGIKQEGRADEKKLERYKWRKEALEKQLDLEHLVIVLQDLNNELNKSNGYLGAISDRSKELYFNRQTVGENLYAQIQQNRHTSLKNQVFYRQDYLDEFEQIWETQKQYHDELTNELKKEVKDAIIFYQRRLKSQKHLVSCCEFEKYHKVVPKSSLLFQEFKIWQKVNNLEFKNKNSNEADANFKPEDELRIAIFEMLNLRGDMKEGEILKIAGLDKREWETNFPNGLDGNRTNAAFYNVYQKIAEYEGYGFDWAKKSPQNIKKELKSIFTEARINPDILDFDAEQEGNTFDKQVSYQLWHLLYSAEDDGKEIADEDKLLYGNSDVALKKKLKEKYGFNPEYASMLLGVNLQSDYGSLSARAIRKILPFLKDGHLYNEACALAGYNHAHSLTAEERADRPLKDKLEVLKKNSLRNPVVEKILNQTINLVNQLIDTYGKPDEVRIELARELKKSAKERQDMTSYISKAKGRHEDIKKILQKAPFNIANPTRNDVIRYKLYEELAPLGYKDIYTNQYIAKENVFSKEIDIEHIIPKSRLFDDSFSNKTLSFREFNIRKGSDTAMNYLSQTLSDSAFEAYKERVRSLYAGGKGTISKGKYNKLLMFEKDIPEDFIERDLRNSQYIAKKTNELLTEVIRTVNTTTGSVTDRLREDWGLVNVMKELNLPKYRALGLTELEERKEGKTVEVIKEWTKRNDHRHHAMDALTVAFTKHSYIQYLNNLNARSDKMGASYHIQQKETHIDENGKRQFIPPIANFREQAKRHLESILISFKTKNKVVTNNVNRVQLKGKKQFYSKVQLTPRGQLHKETVYAQAKRIVVKEVKVGGKFDETMVMQVCKPKYREALLKRLHENENDPKKAFTGKNALSKRGVYWDEAQVLAVPEQVKIQFFEQTYTIRKEITPDLKIEKVVDEGIKRILEQRVEDHGGDKKAAFSNLEEKPIWLDEANGIAIKRVTISGVSSVEALHEKRDHLGQSILDEHGNPIPVDFVSTGNNHHVAIYRDEKGNLQEEVVSFYEAVARVNAEQPVINKVHARGWEFLFTMKQNEMFVFPGEDFDPHEIDLMDEANATEVSKHLYRVQKIASKDYYFRHHLETRVETPKELQGVSYKRLGSTAHLDGVIKVRLNHIGKVVHIGEY